MSDLVPSITPERASEFARRVVERGFRLAEVAHIEGLDLSVVSALLMQPDVAANLERLTTTGAIAIAPAGPRELMEFFTGIMRDNHEKMDHRLAAAKILVDIHRAPKRRRIRAAESKATVAKIIAAEIVEAGA